MSQTVVRRGTPRNQRPQDTCHVTAPEPMRMAGREFVSEGRERCTRQGDFVQPGTDLKLIFSHENAPVRLHNFPPSLHISVREQCAP